MLPVDSMVTFLKVDDLGVSSTFYGELLGLELVLDQGGCLIYRLTDEAFLGVCERPGEVASNVIVTIVTDEVDQWHKKVELAGITTDGPPRDNGEYRIYHFFFNDPDGHSLEVQRFWDESWSSAIDVST